MLGTVLIPIGLCGRNSRKRLLVIGWLVLLGVCYGCGGGSNGGGGTTGTPSGAYSIVVTGTSGSTTQSTTLTLTVQ
jgi:hypothetical protein